MKVIGQIQHKAQLKSEFENFLECCILQGIEENGYTQYIFLSKERSKDLSNILENKAIIKADKKKFVEEYDIYAVKDVAKLLSIYNEFKDNDVITPNCSSDFFMSLRYYIQFLSSSLLIASMDKAALENNTVFYREYLVKCCVSERGKGEFFKYGAQTNYTNKPKKETLYDYDSTIKDTDKVDIYSFKDAFFLLDLLNRLLRNEQFVKRDESNNQHYRSRGLMLYIMALSVRDFMTEQNNKGTIKLVKAFSIKEIIGQIRKTGLIYQDSLIKRFAFSLLTKPFVILSGLAGSGKTQLALAFANCICENPDEQICLVPVGADWTNREPLLGYPNALQKDDYIEPENGVLRLLNEARTHNDKPYFLILDEMNMSYVERYFADFLSAMESGKAIHLWNGNHPSVPKSINLPKNLFIVGTINVDETTYMFSPKVLDRANVIEFKVSHDDMNSFLNSISSIDISQARIGSGSVGTSFVKMTSCVDVTPDKGTKDVLLSFFDELKKVNAEFGYRSAKEIYMFIDVAKRCDDTGDKLTDNQILDAAIIQKLLPKLHGSRSALKDVLSALWNKCFDGDTIDLTIADEELLKQADNSASKVLFPESADKILRMYKSSLANGFTSFAEA